VSRIKYEKEVESVNKSIKEYNDKKKQYDINIKKIDEEQTAYVAKKRTESEEQLGKLSKMLTDEIESLKNKIEEHKINRNLKVKEINELSEKLQEIQKQYDVDTQKKATINNVILISTSTIIVILSVYIYYLKKKCTYF
jgi:uncharacterized protein (UPF0305 family)